VELETELDARVDVETLVEVDNFVEEVVALLDVEAEPPPHPNWILLICHVAVVLENPDQTKEVTAFPLAPEKELKGTVMVCELPVSPVTLV
jgi:hypothetical protein